MKKKSFSIAGVLGTALVSQAAILTFDTGQANNADLASNFGSNLSADIAGANISNGATPNIGLTWAPSPDVWEIHGAATFSSVGDGKVAQMDLNGGEADSTITFSVDAGFTFQLNSLVIGHASDQTEPDNTWTLTLTEVGGSQVFSHTTIALGPGDTETVNFNFQGTTGTDYILKFDDGGADHVRAGIDNLSFNQIPEPASIGVLMQAGCCVLVVSSQIRIRHHILFQSLPAVFWGGFFVS